MAMQAHIEDHNANSRRNRLGLTTANEQAASMVWEWVAAIEATNERKFSEDQRRACFNSLECLCLDLLSASLTTPPVWIGYSRGKENYVQGGAYWDHAKDKAALSFTYFLSGIDYLEAHGLVLNQTADAGYSHFSSRMIATSELIEEFAARGLNWTHVLENADLDCVVVKDEQKRPTTWPDPAGFPLDQALTNLKRINECLQNTQINLNISDEELLLLNSSGVATADSEETDTIIRSKVDFTNRKLRRIFSLNSFQAGGRFYGGWWQSVPSRYRKHIEINGCLTVELDYSTIQPRILYALVGQVPPDDSYLLPGWPKGAELRKITKKAFSQLLNSDPSSRNPNQWHRFAPNVDPDPLPADWYEQTKHQKDQARREAFAELTGREYSELIAALLEFHDPIEEHFFSSVWGATQSKDAEIVERVLLKLLNRDKPEIVLPIHDSFIVRFGRHELLLKAMEEAFYEVVGVEAVIDQDDTILDAPEGYEGHELLYALEVLEPPSDMHETHTGYTHRNEQWEEAHGKSNNMDILLDAAIGAREAMKAIDD